MENSLFIQYVTKYFKIFATKLQETFNGSQAKLVYYHTASLTAEYSPNLKWGALSVNGTAVMADIVALDSSLPLKKRDSIRKADGDIPKTGMKLYLNENTMNEIRIMQAMGTSEQLIIQKLFADTVKCGTGIKETMEYLFLSALSSGFIEVADADNPGLAVRADFNHPDSNKLSATKAIWSDATADPCADIENVISQASLKGVVPRYIWMDRDTWNYFRSNEKVRQSYAFFMDFAGSNVPNLQTIEKANAWMQSEYGLTIIKVDRMVNVEKDGKQKAVKPWADGAVVFTQDIKVGKLQWSTLAEEAFPVKGVDYQKLDQYILLKKYSTTDPVREYTASEAMAIPVIENIDSIFILDSKSVNDTDVQTEGDANFDYDGDSYTRTSVIAAINLAYGTTKAKSNNTDATLLKYVNEMNEEQILVFEANITPSA